MWLVWCIRGIIFEKFSVWPNVIFSQRWFWFPKKPASKLFSIQPPSNRFWWAMAHHLLPNTVVLVCEFLMRTKTAISQSPVRRLGGWAMNIFGRVHGQWQISWVERSTFHAQVFMLEVATFQLISNSLILWQSYDFSGVCLRKQHFLMRNISGDLKKQIYKLQVPVSSWYTVIDID